MAIKFNFDPGKSDDEIRRIIEEVNKKLLESFVRAGEQFIIDCRSQPGNHAAGLYEDITGNLRNSIQYFVFHDGELVSKSEQPETTDTVDVMELVPKSGFCLVGLAGMNYASHVESKGYNVITRQKEALFVNLEKYFEEIQKSIDKG